MEQVGQRLPWIGRKRHEFSISSSIGEKSPPLSVSMNTYKSTNLNLSRSRLKLVKKARVSEEGRKKTLPGFCRRHWERK